jgi:hypothetical protein
MIIHRPLAATSQGKMQMTDKTWKIRTWDCASQSYGPEREVTLAQYRAEISAANRLARAIYKANCERIGRAS